MSNFTDSFLSANTASLPAEQLPSLRQRLELLNDSQANQVIATANIKNPTTALILSIFLGTLGVDRFYLGQVGLGIAKLLFAWMTFGTWTLIDWFLIMNATKKANFQALNTALATMSVPAQQPEPTQITPNQTEQITQGSPKSEPSLIKEENTTEIVKPEAKLSNDEGTSEIPQSDVIPNSEEVAPKTTPNTDNVGKDTTFIAPIAPTQPSDFQKTVTNYWNWLLNAWKNPTGEGTVEANNAFLTFGILILFNTLTIFFAAFHAGRTLTSGINSFSSQFQSTSNPFSGNAFQISNPVGITTLFPILISVALYLFSIILGGFVVKRLIYQNTNFTFIKAFDYYAKLFSINTVLTVLSALLAILNIISLSALLFIISILLFTAGLIFAISQTEDDSSINPFHKYLFALVVNGLIMGIFFYAEMSLIAEHISKLFRF